MKKEVAEAMKSVGTLACGNEVRETGSGELGLGTVKGAVNVRHTHCIPDSKLPNLIDSLHSKPLVAEQFNIATDDDDDNAPELVSESDTEFARIRFRTRHDDN